MNIPEYFHIGVMKTGTTYLQEILSQDDRIQLFNHSRIINTNAYYSRTYGQFDSVKKRIESDENIVDTKGSMCGLYTSLQRIKMHRPDAIIALTIRDQKKLLISGYKHTIRQTDQVFCFEEFLNSSYGMNYLNSTDYYAVVKMIECHFSKDQIRIIPYELIKQKRFISQFYKEVFQLEAPNIGFKKVVNKGLSDRLIGLKRVMNKGLVFNTNSIIGKLERKAHSAILKSLNSFSARQTKKSIHWPSDNELCQSLEEQFKSSNSNLESEYNLGLKELGYPFN